MKHDEETTPLPVAGVPRVLCIIVGVCCFAFSLGFAMIPLFGVYSSVVHRASPDLPQVLVGAIPVLLSAGFALAGWRLCSKDDREPSHQWAKHNDIHWCLGMFGVIGGVLLIAMNFRSVCDLLKHQEHALFAVVFFVVGVQAYATWLWKQRYAALLLSPAMLEQMIAALDGDSVPEVPPTGGDEPQLPGGGAGLPLPHP
ncbi:MAG: hypothetical protein PHR35_16520 [Kiritimatiellae bacterium]|nr:hypothetical protein [Kiritimatiellia bacterium]